MQNFRFLSFSEGICSALKTKTVDVTLQIGAENPKNAIRLCMKPQKSYFHPRRFKLKVNAYPD